MIRYLKGSIQDKEARTIILLVNGVGYQVFVSGSALNTDEEELALFIHTHVREDALTLFGFRTRNELSFFELLLSVNGIGPKMAMEISNEPLEKIQNAIMGGNLAYLTSISGVGKKLAERMVLELKGKVDAVRLPQSGTLLSNNEAHPDVFSALEHLGYKRNHIQKVLADIDESIVETEAIIRFFLQRA